MDINDLRSILAVLIMLVFFGIAAWAYSDRRKADFDEAARLPLEDDDQTDQTSPASPRT